jgi:hypothetical protein
VLPDLTALFAMFPSCFARDTSYNLKCESFECMISRSVPWLGVLVAKRYHILLSSAGLEMCKVFPCSSRGLNWNANSRMWFAVLGCLMDRPLHCALQQERLSWSRVTEDFM